ncbi:MAG: hypothetical protein HC836_50645 [Richelia sp. RM2_1_2]|nr:hypothetical protein [Candidatus Methylacidiphilales bacterium]NJO66040.1 hypothetical protein [Richelia sp. RM2_1_2]
MLIEHTQNWLNFPKKNCRRWCNSYLKAIALQSDITAEHPIGHLFGESLAIALASRLLLPSMLSGKPIFLLRLQVYPHIDSSKH